MTRLRGSISATSLDEVVAWTLAPATVHARREWSNCRAPVKAAEPAGPSHCCTCRG